MTKLSIVLPETGSKDTVAEPRVTTALKAIEEFLNGEKLDTAGGNFKVEGITETSLSSALKTKLGGSFVGLEHKSEAASFEAESAKFYKCTKALTVTLPAATAGRTIAIYALPAVATETVVVSAKAGKVIQGDFTEAETVNLTANQHILVEADGTNWFILAGETKREQKYTATKLYSKVEAEAGVEASATRSAEVTVLNPSAGPATLTVAGIAFISLEKSEIRNFRLNPGQKWVANTEIKEQHILI